MKSYYYFVRTQAGISVHTIVHVVAVGISRREQALLALLQEYSRDCGFYMNIVSNDSDTAIRNLENSLFPGSSKFGGKLIRNHIKISELYRMIMEDSISAFEDNLCQPRHYFYQISRLSPSFFFSNQSQMYHKTAKPKQRKNLSLSDRIEEMSVTKKCWLILGLYWLVSYLETLSIFS